VGSLFEAEDSVLVAIGTVSRAGHVLFEEEYGGGG